MERAATIGSQKVLGDDVPIANTTAKEQMIEILHNQPDDSSFDELLRELAFDRMIKRGLADVEQGRTISNDEMKRRIDSWNEAGLARGQDPVE